MTAYSATALLLAPGTLATGMPSRVSADVEPVETGAGDLDEAQAAAFEQGGRKLRTDGGNDQRGRGLHALRQRRVVRLGVAYLERRRRQRIDAREIGFRPQAENV